MSSDQGAAIADWVIQEGLADTPHRVLLPGFCERLVTAGVPLMRVHLAQRALHPVLGGLGFDWYRGNDTVAEEGYTYTAVPRDTWRRSPFYYMMQHDLQRLRLDPRDDAAADDFPLLADLRQAGATDYYATTLAFSHKQVVPNPDDPPPGMIVSWTSDGPDGFADADIALIDSLLPALGLALKSASAQRVAHDLLGAYLGRDAGERVLSGSMRRGMLDSIRAVIWYFDLHGFTKLSESTPPARMIDMLNDYFDAVVTTVESHGGDVLKFMGDGLLAIFKFADNDDACCDALTAADELRGTIAEINRRRVADGEPATGFSLALHLGEVMYGNIGAAHRLDFTVIGPAVNTAARIQEMCRPLEQDLIISSTLARAAVRDRDRVVSIGRYLLRGMEAPQEFYTLVAPEHAAPGKSNVYKAAE